MTASNLDSQATAEAKPGLAARLAARPAEAVLTRVLARLAVGRLTVILPSGRHMTFGGASPGPAAQMTIHRPRFVRRLLVGGSLGACAAYLDGDWDSPDVAAVAELAVSNSTALGAAYASTPVHRILRRWRQARRVNSRRGSRANIEAHYDLGNAFYAAWLDSSMTYSAGIFTEADASLSAAQEAKYARLAEQLCLAGGEHVLEIGCGWGAFAAYLAQHYDCRVTAVTISPAQYAYARARIAAAGLDDRVTIAFQDYRDVAGRFDRIASIEMLEAVGEAYWPAFFDTLAARLPAGGRAALQVITIPDADFPAYRARQDFIQRYVFPGGLLPPPGRLTAEARRVGFAIAEWANFGAHYAQTLDHWQARFQAAWPALAATGRFDNRFKRLWELYLGYCAGGFRSGSIDVAQIALTRA